MFETKRSLNGKKKRTRAEWLRLISVALIVFMGVCCFLSVFGVFKSFLRVKKFEVSEGSHYEAAELAMAAEIKRGDRLYGLDKKEIEKRILDACPYVEEIKIRQSFPNKIKFITVEREAIWYVEISGDYYVLDGDMRILEETKELDRLNEAGIARLTLPNIHVAMVGEIIEYGNSAEEIENTDKIIELLLSSTLGERISEADIDNRYDIHLKFDESFSASIGGYSKLEVKLNYLDDAIKKACEEGAIGANITILDSAQKVTVQPIYVSPEQNEEVEKEQN